MTVAQFGRAPRCGRGGRGFKSRRSPHGSPVVPRPRARLRWPIQAPLAQLAEHRTLNPQVLGSSPRGRTKRRPRSAGVSGTWALRVRWHEPQPAPVRARPAWASSHPLRRSGQKGTLDSADTCTRRAWKHVRAASSVSVRRDTATGRGRPAPLRRSSLRPSRRADHPADQTRPRCRLRQSRRRPAPRTQRAPELPPLLASTARAVVGEEPRRSPGHRAASDLVAALHVAGCGCVATPTAPPKLRALSRTRVQPRAPTGPWFHHRHSGSARQRLPSRSPMSGVSPGRTGISRVWVDSGPYSTGRTAGHESPLPLGQQRRGFVVAHDRLAAELTS